VTCYVVAGRRMGKVQQVDAACASHHAYRRELERSVGLIAEGMADHYLESPRVVRHPRAPDDVSRQSAAAQVLREARVDLDTRYRAGDVVARFSVRSSLSARAIGGESHAETDRSRRNAESVRGLQTVSGECAELRRRNALHGGKACGADLALHAPVDAEDRRIRLCDRGARQQGETNGGSHAPPP